MQLFSKDVFPDVNGWLDTTIERQFLCDTTILDDLLSEKSCLNVVWKFRKFLVQQKGLHVIKPQRILQNVSFC